MSEPTASQPILILGSGAMACMFAGRLAASGQSVTMLSEWKEGIHALQTNGVCLVSPDGEKNYYPVKATSNPQDCLGARIALVMVKSWQTITAAQKLVTCLAPEGLAITLQNGFGNLEVLGFALGSDRVIAGSTTLAATLLGPGCVYPVGAGEIVLGRHAQAEEISRTLQAARFKASVAGDITSLVWGKMMINVAINPITALLGVPNGFLLEDENAMGIAAEAAREAIRIAKAMHVKISRTDPVEKIKEVITLTAENRSSMLQDLERGAPTEIDYITGAIIHYGYQVNIPTPVNKTLHRLVKASVHSREKLRS